MATSGRLSKREDLGLFQMVVSGGQQEQMVEMSRPCENATPTAS